MGVTKYNKIKVTTRRLVLRPLRAQDYFVWLSALEGRKPKQNRFDSLKLNSADLTRAGFKKRRERWARKAQNDECYIFGVFHGKTGQYLGSVDLYLYMRKDLHWANLGYAILNQYWNQVSSRSFLGGKRKKKGPQNPLA